MRKILLAVAALGVVAGCSKLKYREKERPDPNEVLPSNVWEFETHFNEEFLPGSPDSCKLPRYLVFKNNNTGFYTYDHPCDSTGMDTLHFTWSLSKDKLNLNQVLSMTATQKEYTWSKFIICDYDMVRFEARNTNFKSDHHPSMIIDGYFKPKGN